MSSDTAEGCTSAPAEMVTLPLPFQSTHVVPSANLESAGRTMPAASYPGLSLRAAAVSGPTSPTSGSSATRSSSFAVRMNRSLNSSVADGLRNREDPAAKRGRERESQQTLATDCLPACLPAQAMAQHFSPLGWVPAQAPGYELVEIGAHFRNLHIARAVRLQRRRILVQGLEEHLHGRE